MQCPQCQAANLVDALFCEECGVAFETACPQCSAANRPNAKFCRKCRAALRAVAGVTPEPPHSPAPAPYLIEKIRQSTATLAGERKQVTVFFADVQGSMQLAEQLDPEAFSEIMQRFFAILAEAVERYEGFVDKFTGDGIMALFGAPI